MKMTLARSIIRHSPPQVLDAALREQSIFCLAERLGEECLEDEVQRFADDFRLKNQLITLEETKAWLKKRCIQADDWLILLKAQILERKLLENPRISNQVETEFNEASEDYSRILQMRLLVEDLGIAQELVILAKEDDIGFDILAKRYSVEPASPVNPSPISKHYLYMFEAPSELREQLAGHNFPDPYLSPAMKVGDKWGVYLVCGMLNPILDDGTREAIKQRLLGKMLGHEIDRLRGENVPV